MELDENKLKKGGGKVDLGYVSGSLLWKFEILACFCGLLPSGDLFFNHMPILSLLFDAKWMICIADKSSLTRAELISEHVCAQKMEKI